MRENKDLGLRLDGRVEWWEETMCQKIPRLHHIIPIDKNYITIQMCKEPR